MSLCCAHTRSCTRHYRRVLDSSPPKWTLLTLLRQLFSVKCFCCKRLTAKAACVLQTRLRYITRTGCVVWTQADAVCSAFFSYFFAQQYNTSWVIEWNLIAHVRVIHVIVTCVHRYDAFKDLNAMTMPAHCRAWLSTTIFWNKSYCCFFERSFSPIAQWISEAKPCMPMMKSVSSDTSRGSPCAAAMINKPLKKLTFVCRFKLTKQWQEHFGFNLST